MAQVHHLESQSIATRAPPSLTVFTIRISHSFSNRIPHWCWPACEFGFSHTCPALQQPSLLKGRDPQLMNTHHQSLASSSNHVFTTLPSSSLPLPLQAVWSADSPTLILARSLSKHGLAELWSGTPATGKQHATCSQECQGRPTANQCGQSRPTAPIMLLTI